MSMVLSGLVGGNLIDILYPFMVVIAVYWQIKNKFPVKFAVVSNQNFFFFCSRCCVCGSFNSHC